MSAVEATDFQHEEKRAGKKRLVDVLDGTDREYKRKLAVYQASDNPGKEGGHSVAGIGTRCAFFKMDRINLEALRQCFVDPDVRVRQDFEFTTAKYPRIQAIGVKGGFLDGAKVQFHEGLNSILGAKGAGKSLLVEFMRFALDQPPLSAEILADHEGKLKARLQDYGTVQVVIVDETGKDISLARTYSPAEGSQYQEGTYLDLAQAFPVLFLSQNEIIRVAEHANEQLAFIDRFFDFG